MTSITDRIEAQLDAGSTEVTLTRAEAVEVAQRLHRQGVQLHLDVNDVANTIRESFNTSEPPAIEGDEAVMGGE